MTRSVSAASLLLGPDGGCITGSRPGWIQVNLGAPRNE